MATSSNAATSTSTYVGPYARDVNAAARANGLDPWWFAGLLFHESDRFDPRVVNGLRDSPTGDVGIAQINLASHPEVSRAQASSPGFAIAWAARYLAALKRSAGGSLAGALRAYNTGSPKPSPAGTAYVDQVTAARRELLKRSTSPTPNGPFVSPLSPDARFGRIDQGVDYYQSDPYKAVADGTVYAIGRGFAGGTGLAVYYRLDHPVTVGGANYSELYVAETTPLVKVGDRVKAGQAIASGGDAELGFARGASPLAPLSGGLGAGTKPTKAGGDFKSFLDGIGSAIGGAAGAVGGAIAGVPGDIAGATGLGGIAKALSGIGSVFTTITDPRKLEDALLWMLFVALGVALIFIGVTRLFAPDRRELDPSTLALFQQPPGGAGAGAGEAADAAVLA